MMFDPRDLHYKCDWCGRRWTKGHERWIYDEDGNTLLVCRRCWHEPPQDHKQVPEELCMAWREGEEG